MKLRRRGFLQALGAGAAALSIPGCTNDKQRLAERFALWMGREEAWRTSVCRLCPGGCGLRVRVVDGRPVQVLGNPLHPVNRGGLCPRGLASLDRLYDPDRLAGPLQRSGPRGSGRWRSITWDDALTLVADRLAQLRSAGVPERLVILDGQEPGIRERIVERFARAFGTPNHVRFRLLDPERIALTHALMQGGDAPLGYDLARASYLLCFGTNLFESWISPVSQMRAFSQLRRRSAGPRGRLVVVEPRLSVTAARADRWVPIQPGTEGALAMGIAHVILRESLYDHDFLERHAFGFEDWTDESGRRRTGYRTLVLSEYNPLAVSRMTGVRAETILTLAREFAAAKPALAIGEPEFSWGPNDFYDRMAIHALNALTGNVAGRGVLAVQGRPPATPLQEPPLDETARAGLARPRVDGAGEGKHFLTRDAVQALPERILARRPYETSVLLLLDANPVFSHPAKAEFARAVAEVPFVVSTSGSMDETAELADLILPDASFLERWDAVEARHHAGFSLLSVAEPAVPPAAGLRDSADVLLDLAARVGGTTAAALPWRSSAEMLEHLARGLFDAERGHVVSTEIEESFRRILERQGFRDPEFGSFEEFWAALRERGAWWDPTDTADDPRSLFHTETRRFEFSSRRLERLFRAAARRRVEESPSAQAGEVDRLREEMGIQAEGDRLFLPHHEKPRTPGDPDFPLLLRPFFLLSLGTGETASSPWVQEVLAVHLSAAWESWVEVNPETALAAGIGDRDEVWVESSKGRLRTRVRVFEGVMPGVVAMPIGQGHRVRGSRARRTGVNPMDLVENVNDARAGMAVLGLTPVRIVRV